MPRGRLVGAAALNTGFAVVQIVVGLAIGSVVVLADAAHQIVDALGLLTALAAVILAARPANETMSFGWGKADALGGFVSALLLLASVVWIAYESVQRLSEPVEVSGGSVIVIGLIAIAVNGLSVLALGRQHDAISLKAARLHLLTDLAGSVIVVVAGVVLVGTTARWVDPVASLVLCLLVLRSTGSLLLAAASELLDRAPATVSAAEVKQVLLSGDAVTRVHHIHISPLGQQRTSVTAHVVIEGNFTLHEAQRQVDDLTAVLTEELPVSHVTLQIECHPCETPNCE
ncbi:MAG: cation diffusion facilitator family transporter [Acidimicrobiia bacterium]|nr:cation diffusion facilitator family transporter [Acidimicrobiia bacterium]